MNICFFIGNLNLSGGTERVTTVIANELAKKGYNIFILNLYNGRSPFFQLSTDIINNFVYPKGHSGIKSIISTPTTIFKIRRYVKKNMINIFIDVDTILSIYSTPALIKLNIKHFSWEHFNYNANLGKIKRKIARRLTTKFSDLIITLTNKDRETWINNGYHNTKVITINNPITVNNKRNSSDNLKNNIFLAAGRLTNQKGFDLLLHSWSLIIKNNPGWILKIVGDGEERDNLINLIALLNIKNSVELHDRTNNISRYYNEASFFILSSRFEGFGLVLLEAQSYGLPVISFDCEMGPSEIIKHNETGWLCENGNIYALSNAIEHAININEKDYQTYQNASIINSSRFNVDNIIESWCNIINIK